MHSSADKSSGVTRLNHFISVWGDNRRDENGGASGRAEWGDGGVSACFVSVWKSHFQSGNYDAGRM